MTITTGFILGFVIGAVLMFFGLMIFSAVVVNKDERRER